MTDDISFCPVCAGKVEALGRAESGKFKCEDCELEFVIRVTGGGEDEEEGDEY